MPLLEQTVTTYTKHRGSLSREETVRIGIASIKILEKVHRHGFLHCDVKPCNLMLDREFKVHLVDFGITRRYCSEAGVHLADIPEKRFSGTYHFASQNVI